MRRHAAKRSAFRLVSSIVGYRNKFDAARPIASERLHGQEGEIVDETNLFLHEGLAVANAGEQAVVARLGEGALANLLFGNKERRCLRIGWRIASGRP